MSVTDAPTPRVAPPSGWYPDPTGIGHTRFWDGAGWTDLTRSSASPVDVPPISVAAPLAPAPPARSRNWVAFLIVIVIVAFAGAGAVHVVGGSGGGSGDPSRFNGDNVQAQSDPNASATRDGPCTGTNRPSATAIVALLHDRGLPVTAVEPPLPAGAPVATTPPATAAAGLPVDPLCSKAAFDDPRGGRATAYAFVSAAEADRAITAGLAGSGVAVKAGHIVVTLPPDLAGQQMAYRTALDTLPAMVRR